MTLQRITFTSIPVADQDRALTFYTGTMGFSVHTDAPHAEGWRWIFLTLPGAETRLHLARTDEIAFTGVPALYLVSDDVDVEAGRLRALGIDIASGPEDAPWAKGVRWLMIRDTENNLILIESFKEP